MMEHNLAKTPSEIGANLGKDRIEDEVDATMYRGMVGSSR